MMLLKYIRLFFLFILNFFICSLYIQAQLPSITSFSPSAATVGSSVVISGSGFNAIATNNNVFFGATKAQVTAAGNTQLTVNVPYGALHYPITVGTNNGTAYSGLPFLPTFPAGTLNFNNRSFSTAIDAASAAAPEALVYSDFDGDGKSDLAVACISGAVISVSRNISSNGTVAFAIKQDFAAGSLPLSIASGDLNGDGKPDIAITNIAAVPTVSVFINTSTLGNISFAAIMQFTVGAGPRGIDINDIDSDGKPDIVCTNSNGNSISVLRNTTVTNSLSFAPKIDFNTGNFPYNISLRDIDGDGKADAAVSNQFSSTVSILRNTSSVSTISFAAKIDIATGSNPRGITCGDIDGDGKQDIATGNYGSSNISVLKNTSTVGNISFAAKVDFGLSPLAQTEQLAIGDLNGDGKPDIAVVDPYQVVVNIFRNTSVIGNITMASRVFYTTASGPKNVGIGDIDGDGKADLGVVCNGANKVSVFRNIAAPVVTSFSPTSGVAGSSVTITGFNFRNTGSENVVFFGGSKATVTAGSNTLLTVTVPNGATNLPLSVTADGLTGHAKLPFTLTFNGGDSIIANSYAARKIFASGANGRDACIADFDADGKNDIAIPTYSNGSISIFRNISTSGNLNFSTPFLVANNNAGYNDASVTAADLNGDGKPELIMADGDANTVSVYRNTSTTGNISFITTAVNIYISGTASKIYIADVNSDGRPEIIAESKGYIAVIPNNCANTSTLSFGTALLTNMDNYLDKIAVADFDGDGKVDIISGQSYLLNTSMNGVISFSPLTNFAATAQHNYYVIGDFNSDGKPDIAALNSTSRRLRVYNNTSTVGNISFVLEPIEYTTGMFPVKLSVADLNGDGKPDIAVANFEHDAISVIANTTSSTTISFAGKVDYEAGNWPSAVAVGDLDGDGKPDIVTPNFQSSSFSVFRFNIDLLPPNIPVINSFTPNSVQVGDTITISGNNFSNTANDNIVLFGNVKGSVINANGNTLTVKVPVGAMNTTFSVTNPGGLTGYSRKAMKIIFPGAGPAFQPNAFDTAKLFSTGITPSGLCIGDLDGDGKNDVVTANFESNNVSVFHNISIAGYVNFDPTINFPVGNEPKACTIADLNADGKPELLVANSANNTVTLFRNISVPGTISFAAPVLIATDSSGFGHPAALKVFDLDGDGKPDLAVANRNSTYITCFRNITSFPGGAISFAAKIHIKGGQDPISLFIKDLDGNGKPDIVVGNEGNQVSILSNTSSIGNISFTRAEKFNANVTYGSSGIVTTDLNDDNKFDIVMNANSGGLSRMNNESVRGTHFFSGLTGYGSSVYSSCITSDDFDGDGRSDIVLGKLFNTSVSVNKNIFVTNDTAYFNPTVSYSTYPAPFGPNSIASGDIDGDGKPDIAGTVPVNYLVNHLIILRNKVGEALRLCDNGGTTFTSNISSSSYQWQLSTDSGVTFNNINDNVNYAGTSTLQLSLSNIPSSWTGYKYRCISDNGATESFSIRFFNNWIGGVDNQWEIPLNWSCGAVPDYFTDVVIGPGATVTINSNVSIATLALSPGASLTVNPTYTVLLVGH